MSEVLLLSSTGDPTADILPSLSLLAHTVRLAPASAAQLRGLADASAATPAGGALADGPLAGGVRTGTGPADVVLVDARRDLIRIRQLLGHIDGIGVPVLAIITEGGWAAVTADWGTDDVILNTAGPGEVEARIRLAIGRAGYLAAGRTDEARSGKIRSGEVQAGEVRSGELVINEATYSARIGGTSLDLTFKEFELLKFLAQHPRRVFTRSQLLQEVWGYDYFGGTRTVDVHVRRLRAKLGIDNEALIGTVRNVGYKFVPAKAESRLPGAGASGGSSNKDGPAPSGPSRSSDDGVRR